MTLRKLLEAGLAEIDEHGFHAVRVKDVVRRAQTAHGTFYQYFCNKEDLFKTLLRYALREMNILASDFPIVTPNQSGRAALSYWVERYCQTYGKHAAVLRVLSSAEIISEDVWGDGLRTLFRLGEAITTGMTAARHGCQVRCAELNALACAMMLERVNYFLTAGVTLPAEDLLEGLSAMIYATFDFADPGPDATASADSSAPSGQIVVPAN